MSARFLRLSTLLLGLAVCSFAATAQQPTTVITGHEPGGPGVGGPSNEFYIPNRVIQLTVNLTADGPGPVTALLYRLQLPTGFTFIGLTGANPPQLLPLGNSGTLDFIYTRVPAFPASFRIDIKVPAGAKGNYTVRGRGNYGVAGGALQLGNEVSNLFQPDTVAPFISLIGSSRITANCQGAVIDPGVIATDNAEGDVSAQVIATGNVDTTVPGTYTRTYSITDASGNVALPRQRTIVVLNNCPGSGEGEGENPCDGNCATAPKTDSDGDGLTDCEERCITGTLPNFADSDLDGMDDKYESENSPPLDATRNDAQLDGDGDGISNLDEFLRGTNPGDSNDPQVVFVVSTLTGNDTTGDGTRARPWKTINFAITQAAVAATPEKPTRVIVLGGVYSEDVVMADNVNVTGEALVAPGGTLQPVLEGTVVGADNTDLVNLTIEGITDNDLLIDATGGGEGLNMLISKITLRNGGTGIATDGLRGGETIIENCRLSNLKVGLEIRGAIPVLRRSVFGNISAPAGEEVAGVIVRATTLAVPADATLGDVTDPEVGFNQFNINTIAGPAVINERATLLKVEGNDWKSNDAGTIGASLVGPTDFEPFLGAGAAILAGSLFCTVIDGTTQERITDATISLVVSAFAPVTDNLDGVYAFPALSDGSYQVITTVDGFDTDTKTVYIKPGSITGLVIPLGVVVPGETGGCNNNAKVQVSQRLGDVLMYGMALAAMAGAAFFTRRVRF